MEPCRAIRVGATQSNWSTPRATASRSPTGSPHAHEVAGPVSGQQRHGEGQFVEHGGTGLSYRQPSDAVPVEVQFDGAAGALLSQRGVGAALDDAEERLPLRPGLE